MCLPGETQVGLKFLGPVGVLIHSIVSSTPAGSGLDNAIDVSPDTGNFPTENAGVNPTPEDRHPEIPAMTSLPSDRNIDLVVGFDAMRAFLLVRWEEDDRQSDDLANLLSNMNRDVWRNSQPLGIAQWSDWLDAVLSVRPDLADIRNAQQQMAKDHQKLVRILKMEPLEQRAELDKYRVEMALQPWHRIGQRPVSPLDAYEAMRAFLSSYWSRGGKQSRDIGAILDGLKHEKTAARMAQWDAWLAAVQTAKAQADRQN